MSNQDNTDALLSALRRVGITLPGAPAIPLRQPRIVSSVERSYWHIVHGPFETMVDKRDAASEQEALVAAMSSLQAWYTRQGILDLRIDTEVKSASREEYVEWLRAR